MTWRSGARLRLLGLLAGFAGWVMAGVALTGGAPACSSGSAAGDAGPSDATTAPSDGEPVICTQFTSAGDPCPTPSPVRCFPECEAGGCYCTQTSSGARWVCQTDLSCMPDCAPVDDGCSPVPTGGDDGGGGSDDDAADAGADGDAADAAGAADAGDAASDAASDGPAASDASAG
jgi:hypothetical protein